MFNELKQKGSFYKKYIKFYIERFTYSSISVENQDVKEKNITNYIEAFNYLIGVDSKLTVSDIERVGDLVNKENGLQGLRKINVLSGSEFEPVEPERIPFQLFSQLSNYYKIWDLLDPYEREAMFHINFMLIHPFEDGNKRVAKLILNTNLLKQGCAPVIITKEDTEQYYEFINSKNYLGFAEFLRQRSNIELNNMVGLYKLEHHISEEKTGDNILGRKK